MTSTNGDIYYLYAIARSCVGQAAPLPIEGILPAVPVYTLAHQQLTAVFSPVPFDQFGQTHLEQHLQNDEWICARVLAHQRVLTDLLPYYTVLPCGFCTLFREQSRITALLAEHDTAFEAALERVAGATEWGVKIFCDRAALGAWVEASAPQLEPLRQSIARASEGAGYMLKKKLQQSAVSIVEGIGSGLVDASYAQLQALARNAVSSPLQSQQVHGRPTEMVLNSTYLVPDADHAAFLSALKQLQTTHGPCGFTYELTGPWPPYSFAALQLQEASNG